ncbi:MAG: class I SAM-dependent DNA methyltransferase, partial [Chloroflexi bacterium]
MTISAAQEFVDRWERSTVNEKGTAQPHFIDLCRLLGIKTPVEADPHGAWYRFEKPLKKEGGGAGFADVWRAETFAWEYKSKDRYATLDDALTQLRLYKSDLGNPPVLVVSDIARFEVYIEFNGFKTRVEKFTNADLVNAATRDLLRAALTDPQQLRPSEKTFTITEKIAKQFGEVAKLVERRGHDPHDVAHFFMKLLFCMFAEDIGLLPNHLLSETLRAAVFNPDEFNALIRPLFREMRTGGYWGPGNRIPHFNGGLFDDDFAIPLKVDDLQF